MKTNIYLTIIAITMTMYSCGNKGLEYDASGIFETTEVIVSSQGNGEIKQFAISEGDILTANQQVGLIDTIQLHLKLEQLEASRGSINNKKTNISTQVASLQQEIETQKREQKRYQQLLSLNAANQKQLDDINAQIKLLEKKLSAQFETVNNTNNSLTEESVSLNAQIAQLKDQINKSIITSPISGTVLSKYAEPGELAVSGKALFKIADIDTMYLRAYITASQLTTAKIGQQVKVYSDLGESDRKEYDGKIVWIADKAEFTPKTIQTRDERANLVYAVKIEVKNDGYIKKGMYGEVKF